MLKTNSKKVKEKIRAYLLKSFTDYEENPQGDRSASEVFRYIGEGIAAEKLCYSKERRASRFMAFYKGSIGEVIKDYCEGLGGLFDTSYYVRPCIDIVGDILEETKEERQRFSESEAEDLMTYLISRELAPYVWEAIYK